MKLEFEVGKTGHDWQKLEAEMQQAKTRKWFDNVPHDFSDLNELSHYWRTLYSYDPALALEKVSCPVLALFGALDNSTPVPQTIANMRRALKKARNGNFTYRVFPRGNHGLLEAKTGYNSEVPTLRRFVPGLFDTMTLWLSKRSPAR
jgi:pimeloyl-ACP methyl ester carboxylesterase